MEETYVLAVDLGGTRLRLGLVDGQGRVVSSRRRQTRADQGPERVVGRLIQELKDLASEVESESILGLGVSVASPLDPETGTLYNPPNLPGWDMFSPRPALEDALKLQVFISNDATLAALGEHRFGAGRGYRNLIFMTVSTGIGGGVLIDGWPYSGSRGFAGEIGHIIIDPQGPLCGCGSRGCLESLASGTAIARIARERMLAGESSLLHQMVNGEVEKVRAETVSEAAKKGDGLAKKIMEEAGASLGLGIASLLNIFDPELVILGGAVAQAPGNWSLLFPSLRGTLDQYAMTHQRGRNIVVRGALGDDVSLLGAAAWVFAHAK